MWLEGFLRTQLRRLLTKENHIALENKRPSLESKFQDIDEFGLYLHIPFCRQICPYCPYNKEIYHPEVAERYTDAVKKEIDIYSDLIGNKPVTSFYIGGGTPTTMLYSGLGQILEHVFEAFNMQCGTHMESHPNDLSIDNLNAISSMRRAFEHRSGGLARPPPKEPPQTVYRWTGKGSRRPGCRKGLQVRQCGHHFRVAQSDLQ